MGDFSNAYKRLSELMALLMSERFPEGLTVNEISSSLNVPTEVVKKDLLAITGDEHPIRIDPDVFLPEYAGDVVAVNLSPFEKNVFARAANVSHLSDSVWIKKPALAVAETPPGIMGPLQMAIEQGHPMTFTYITETGEEKAEGFVPRQIYTDLFTGRVYLAGKPGSKDGAVHIVLKRIDRIRNLKVHNDENVPPVKPGELDVLDYIWGGDIYPDEMAQKGGYVIRHVKIRISKDTGNIYEKIKTETNGRRFGKLYDDPENEEIAYYEDDVCGMGSFKRWLLGYGASVMVLEPVELAEEMYRILLNRLERYRDF